MTRAALFPLLLACSVGVSGCATTRSNVAELSGGRVVVDMKSGAVEPLGGVIDDLASVRHVYVGEVHGSPTHHAVQLEVLDSLFTAGAPVTIAVEWIPALAQPALDEWTAGTLSEAQLVERVNWRRVWGHDFNGYRPIFAFARVHKVRVVGLNPPPGLAEAVGRGGRAAVPKGLLDSLPPLDTGNEPHRQFFLEKFLAHGAAHGHGRFEPAQLERYYQAQLVRDETMANGVARLVQADPARVVVVFAGIGHIDRALGIPLRAEKQAGPFRIVQPVPVGEMSTAAADFAKGDYPERRADWAWEGPRLGGLLARRALALAR